MNDCPYVYVNEPDQESYTIVTQDEYGDDIILPLFLRGVTSHLNVEPLTCDEFEMHNCPRITLTSRDLTWDPSSTVYEDQETILRNCHHQPNFTILHLNHGNFTVLVLQGNPTPLPPTPI